MEQRVIIEGSPAQFAAVVAVIDRSQIPVCFLNYEDALENPDIPLVHMMFSVNTSGGFGFITAQALPKGRTLIIVASSDAEWPTLEVGWNMVRTALVEQGWIALLGSEGVSVPLDATPSPPALPPVTDPIDQRILKLVQNDPALTDKEIGQQLDVTRQAVNERRRALHKMGYPVR